MKYRGIALKARAKRHLVNVMHSIPECSPVGNGQGPKFIGHRAGFNFHSEFKRHYARGLILEMIEEGIVESIPTSPGSSKNKYRLTMSFYCPPIKITPSHLLDLQMEGASILAEGGKIICDYLFANNGEWVSSPKMERETGLYEKLEDHEYRGFFAWLVREELTHAGIIETKREGKSLSIRLVA